MKVTQEVVRIFWENGTKKAVLFKNGTTEFMMLRNATNDQIDELLEVNKEQKEKKHDTHSI